MSETYKAVRGMGWQGCNTTWNPYGRKWAIYADDGAPAPSDSNDERLARGKRGEVRTFTSRATAEKAAAKMTATHCGANHVPDHIAAAWGCTE